MDVRMGVLDSGLFIAASENWWEKIAGRGTGTVHWPVLGMV